ncbi:hypothetical protein NUW54_g3268 [Trametes sanguinea]|uniref:Uncharacterized protein n=1 Tax=Trametes sanguinea TaxID=158606 RepID=A0ACC1Q181_9APHY|nr:hypothetical protein NUW54_g3268 [Trametes sanguinea]
MLRKTSIKMATLNMNGFGNLRADSSDNKWRTMYKMIKNNRIGILVLQETHLTPERRTDIAKMFKGRIKILHSAHPDAPTRKEGVAIVLNRAQIHTNDAQAVEVVPGRALQVSVKCHGNKLLHVLCIYAPTSDGVDERRLFFRKVREFYDMHPGIAKPSVMAGDFNNVEDPIDRLPISEPDASLAELDSLKMELGLMLIDGWRATNPTDRAYTFHRGSGEEATCSRLDRIYVTTEVFDQAREWQIKPPAIKTDHCLVSVQISMADAPMVGKGRPTFALHLTKDKTLAKQLKETGMKALQQLEQMVTRGNRSEDHNPQILLSELKKTWLHLAREREKELVPKLLQEISELNKELHHAQNDQHLTAGARATTCAKLSKRITDLEIKRANQQQLKGKAKHKIEGERPTKYWTRIHKPCAPRELINAFEREDQRDQHGNRVYESDPAEDG